MRTRGVIVKVQGRGRFPIDMLRRDELYPHTEQDSNTIQQTFEEVRSDNWTIYLARTYQGSFWYPTEGRWNSFGWDIVSVEGD